MVESEYKPQNINDNSETEKIEKEKNNTNPKKFRSTIIILLLMLLSFLIGWRYMAYKWWPVLNPYIKQIAYKVLPSLQPTETTIITEDYEPRSDAKVGDPISASDSVFYYFYFPSCPYCATNGNMLLAGLPEFITLPDGSQSRIVMISLNKHDEIEYEYINAYYTSHNVIKNDEQNDQIVPSIVIGDTYLSGSDQIRDNFYKLLLSGAGQNTLLIDGADRTE